MSNYVKVPTVFQMEHTECGAASLAMIFAYFGKHLPLEQMRIETGVSRDGCSAVNIMRAAKQHGLNCRGYRQEVEALKTISTPCIIHWNFCHFVVFEGYRKGIPYINDPALGRRKLTQEELDEGFTGVVLTFEKTDAFQPQKNVNTLPDFIRQRLKGQKEVLFKLVYIGLLLVFPGLVLPVLSQIFMDDVIAAGYTDWMPKILIFMGLLAGLKLSLTYYRDLILQKLASKLTLMSGFSFLRHLFRLPISFFDQRHAGDLAARMDNNTQISQFLAGDLAETVLNILVAVFYLVILLLYSPLLTLVGLLSVSISLLVVYYCSQAIGDIAMRMQISGGKLHSAVCAGLSITDTLKASGAEEAYAARILGHQAKHANLEQSMIRCQQIADAVPDALGQITDVLILMLGGILVMQGDMTMGMLIAFSSLFTSFSQPVNALVGFIHSIQTLKANLCRVDDISRYPQDLRYDDTQKKTMRKRKLSGDIRLENVSFGYSRLKPPLVEHFSFHLRSGESIAFVGASGCGKSTVAKMVSGLYQPWAGEIFLDGHPIHTLSREVLNASIATVSQNITLFSGSIRDNLTMWNNAILEEDMIAAAKDACIHDFIIQQPGGYDYPLTENAANLSGGQRQRLEIARALATKPTILVMDEATSALDPIVEKQILDNIKRRGCTCVIVAHRLSAIRDCNQIVVMDQGHIVQRGSHSSLIQEEGYYSAFVQNI